MQLSIVPAKEGQRKPRPAPGARLEFGRQFTDHMFLMSYARDRGWQEPRIAPYGPLTLDPAALVFHYGQACFEGLKAYPTGDGQIHLFRAERHLARLNHSAQKLCMPSIDVAFVHDALRKLVALEREWMPKTQGASLYIRPTLISTEAGLGMRVSSEYVFFIIVCPVEAYWGADEAIKPVRIHVSDEYVRAVRGGVGDTKVGGNYAASMRAQEAAQKAGCVQTLWLDAIERKYVEEVGTMNLFLVLDDALVTPPLGGTILPGVTRDSVLTIARDKGLRVEERAVSIDEVLDGAGTGRLTEAFGTGTAVVISPISALVYQGREYPIGNQQSGPVALALYQDLYAAQHGKAPAYLPWLSKI
jgi:branched-chain amino acid aminotransferase